MLSSCASQLKLPDPPKCNKPLPHGACLNPLYASMPQPISHPIKFLAVIPLNTNKAEGLSQSLQEEINARVGMAAFSLKESAPQLQIVERAGIEAAFRELEFQASGRVREDHFVGVGKMLGADHLLIYQPTVTFDKDMASFQKRGGILRAITHGKVLHVQTGTVVFHQTIEQSISWPSPVNGREWLIHGLDLIKRDLVFSTIRGLFLALNEALLPSPTGIDWGIEEASDRVVVLFVLLGSPGHYAGIQEGDHITAIDGIPVNGVTDPVLQKLERIPRELSYITIQRRGQERTFVVRFAMH